MHASYRLVAILCTMLVNAAAFAGPWFSVTDLGVDKFAIGINAAGHVTGTDVIPGETVARAFVHDGVAARFLEVPGGSRTQGAGGQAINASGHVAGSFQTEPGGGIIHAFLDDGSAMKDLGTLPGGVVSTAYGINASSQVVGFSVGPLAGSVESYSRAVIWDGTTVTDLGTLPGGINSAGYGINGSGQVTGEADIGGQQHAFLFDGTTMRDLGALPGHVGSFGWAINDHAQVTGWSVQENSQIVAVRFDGNATVDLGTFGWSSYGRAINNHGWVAGYVRGLGGDRAFLHDGSAMVDLNSVLDGSGAGWVLRAANAINDSGQIAGTGEFNGETHAFLLTINPAIPEPATYLLWLMGIGAIAARATRALGALSSASHPHRG